MLTRITLLLASLFLIIPLARAEDHGEEDTSAASDGLKPDLAKEFNGNRKGRNEYGLNCGLEFKNAGENLDVTVTKLFDHPYPVSGKRKQDSPGSHSKHSHAFEQEGVLLEGEVRMMTFETTKTYHAFFTKEGKLTRIQYSLGETWGSCGVRPNLPKSFHGYDGFRMFPKKERAAAQPKPNCETYLSGFDEEIQKEYTCTAPDCTHQEHSYSCTTKLIRNAK